MASFVPLPSPYNPYIGAAEGAASAGASIYNAKRAAERQQQQHEQARADKAAADKITEQQRHWNNVRELGQGGWIPVNDEYSPAEDRPSLLDSGTPNVTGAQGVPAGGTAPQGAPGADNAGQAPGADDATFQPAPAATRAAPRRTGQGVYTTEGGQTYYHQSKAEEEDVKRRQQGAFVPTGQLGDLLRKAGWDGQTALTPAESHSLVQALDAAQPKHGGPFQLNTSGNFLDGQGNPVPVIFDPAMGTVRMVDLSGAVPQGQPAQPSPTQPSAGPAQGGLPWGPFAIPPQQGQTTQAPQQPGYGYMGAAYSGSLASPGQGQSQAAVQGGLRFQKPEKEPRKETAEDWERIITDPASDPAEVKRAQAALTLHRATSTEADKDRHLRIAELADNAAQRKADAEQRRADAQAKVEEKFAKDHEAAGLKKQNMQSMAQGYWDASGTQAGATYFPPRLVNGIVVSGPATLMPSDDKEADARRNELKTTAKGFEKTAKTHQDEQERIEKARGWGKFAPQPAAAAPSTPPAPGGGSAAPKTASLAQIRAYAQKNSISEAEATRRVKAEGFSIGK